MDALTHLFTHFNFRTNLFYVGRLCRIGSFNEENKGYLHFIREGRFILHQTGREPMLMDKPCIVFAPTNVLHSLHPVDKSGLDIFSIGFDFGNGVLNPLTHTLHNIVVLELSKYELLTTIAEQIFDEAHEQTAQVEGCQAIMHHLCAYFTLKVARECLVAGHIQSGLLKGMADKRLGKVLLDIHQAPEKDWSVEVLAERALMSRSRFAAAFKEVMGLSPMDYVTNWRIAVAQNLLKKGTPVGVVAEKVGYNHSATLSRIFVRELGVSPTEWLAKYKSKA